MKTRVKNILLIGIILSGLFPISFIFAQNLTPILDTNSLNERINSLETVNIKILNTVYWTLGIFASIFLAIVVSNFFSNKSINKDKIKTIKEELENLIDNKNNLIKEEIEKNTEENLIKNNEELKNFRESMISNIKNQEYRWKAETSRSMAFHCKSLKYYDNAFIYSIEAAYNYLKIEDYNLSAEWLEIAEENLISAEMYQFNAKFFDDNLTLIKSEIDFLKSKYETRVARIEKLLNEKLEHAKQVKSLSIKTQ